MHKFSEAVKQFDSVHAKFQGLSDEKAAQNIFALEQSAGKVLVCYQACLTEAGENPPPQKLAELVRMHALNCTVQRNMKHIYRKFGMPNGEHKQHKQQAPPAPFWGDKVVQEKKGSLWKTDEEGNDVISLNMGPYQPMRGGDDSAYAGQVFHANSQNEVTPGSFTAQVKLTVYMAMNDPNSRGLYDGLNQMLNEYLAHLRTMRDNGQSHNYQLSWDILDAHKHTDEVTSLGVSQLPAIVIHVNGQPAGSPFTVAGMTKDSVRSKIKSIVSSAMGGSQW